MGDDEGRPRWSREALQAMDTHLSLLQLGAANSSSQCEMEQGLGYSAGRVRRPSGLSICQQADIDEHLHRYSAHAPPLPFGWEQFLHLQTGQVYYIDWKKCRRSYLDPRSFSLEHDNNSNDMEESECMSDADNSSCVSSFHDAGRLLDVNKLPTSPMLQEDWDLMETRGWITFDSDDHSEITCELKPATYPIRDCDSPSV